jgi:hypothetical protein
MGGILLHVLCVFFQFCSVRLTKVTRGRFQLSWRQFCTRSLNVYPVVGDTFPKNKNQGGKFGNLSFYNNKKFCQKQMDQYYLFRQKKKKEIKCGILYNPLLNTLDLVQRSSYSPWDLLYLCVCIVTPSQQRVQRYMLAGTQTQRDWDLCTLRAAPLITVYFGRSKMAV